MKIQHLCKSFDDRVVLDHVSLTLESGGTACLMAPSGRGKTTLLRCIAGLERPDSGQITDLPERIGYVFQEDRLCDGFSAVDNIRLVTGRAMDEGEICRHLKELGLADSLGQPVRELSGGMRQRVMIAMALACEPDILIADEPTTALDVTIQAQILKLMNDLKKEKGTSILFITHDLGVINEMADDVAVMYCGQVVEKAPVRSIFGDNSYLHPYTEGLLYSIPRLDTPTGIRLEAIPGAVPHPLDLPKGCKFAPRCKYATDKCREMEPELNEVEPGHMVRCFYPKKGERN